MKHTNSEECFVKASEFGTGIFEESPVKSIIEFGSPKKDYSENLDQQVRPKTWLSYNELIDKANIKPFKDKSSKKIDNRKKSTFVSKRSIKKVNTEVGKLGNIKNTTQKKLSANIEPKTWYSSNNIIQEKLNQSAKKIENTEIEQLKDLYKKAQDKVNKKNNEEVIEKCALDNSTISESFEKGVMEPIITEPMYTLRSEPISDLNAKKSDISNSSDKEISNTKNVELTDIDFNLDSSMQGTESQKTQFSRNGIKSERLIDQKIDVVDEPKKEIFSQNDNS